jgi:hypothetical protein
LLCEFSKYFARSDAPRSESPQSFVAAGRICVIVALMRRTTPSSIVAWISFCALFTTLPLHADQVQMLNGDHYAGKIVSLNSNSIVFESDVLGKVMLPREKVASMNFGAGEATNAPGPVAPRVVTATNRFVRSGTNNIAVALRNGTNTLAIEQVRQQMLIGAPEANQQYNEMLSGLMSGKLSVNDIRAQARTSIDQINKMKREMGPQADPMLDTYLEILQNFVNEAEPSAPAKPALPAPPANIATSGTAATPAASFGTNSQSLQGK